MLSNTGIRVANAQDAHAIAELSRDTIEHGLAWSWTPARVLSAMRDPATNVVVVQRGAAAIAGFGIMQYGDKDAHLALLAVHPTQRHQGLGARIVAWLEQSARAAGIGLIRLEARADNRSAIAFYARLQFSRAGTVAGYYEGTVDAIRMEKKLVRNA